MAECSVMMVTASLESALSRSMTSEICSRKPPSDSNSSMERLSSLRFSLRPWLSTDLSALSMSI
ncbi:hypothetical protein D3C87_2206280 [compost metagenome]